MKLIQKILEALDTTTFIFQPQEPLAWRAGQYLRYKIEDSAPDERGNTRYFTIASAPYEKVVRLTTRIAREKGNHY